MRAREFAARCAVAITQPPGTITGGIRGVAGAYVGPIDHRCTGALVAAPVAGLAHTVAGVVATRAIDTKSRNTLIIIDASVTVLAIPTGACTIARKWPLALLFRIGAVNIELTGSSDASLTLTIAGSRATHIVDTKAARTFIVVHTRIALSCVKATACIVASGLSWAVVFGIFSNRRENAGTIIAIPHFGSYDTGHAGAVTGAIAAYPLRTRAALARRILRTAHTAQGLLALARTPIAEIAIQTLIVATTVLCIGLAGFSDAGIGRFTIIVIATHFEALEVRTNETGGAIAVLSALGPIGWLARRASPQKRCVDEQGSNELTPSLHEFLLPRLVHGIPRS